MGFRVFLATINSRLPIQRLDEFIMDAFEYYVH